MRRLTPFLLLPAMLVAGCLGARLPANIKAVKTPNNVVFKARASASSSYGDWGTNFKPSAAVDGITFESHHPETFWLLPDSTTGFLSIDPEGTVKIDRIRLLNTHNSGFNDRGTKDFHVDVVDRDGKTTTVWRDRFPSIGGAWMEKSLDGVIASRIVVHVDSYFHAGGGLTEVEVIGSQAPPTLSRTRQQQIELASRKTELESLKQETKLTKQKLELERTRRELELEKAKTEAARLRQEPPRIIATAVDQAKLSDYSNIDFGKYYALVIGNNAYEHLPDLKTATNDAKTVAKLLQDEYGFNVSLLINARREEILDALDVYREKLGNTDNLLIYYAGHGWLDKAGEQGYWLPIDAQENRRSKWISNTAISTTLKALEAKHVMVVVDSCYSGTLVRGLKIRGKTGDYIKRMTEKRARVVLTSGGLEPVADLGGGGHSPFAKAFVDVLSANTSVMDGTSMFSELRRLVILSADQTPEYSDARKAGHDGGDFLFVRKK